jgi:hypothetical protein
MGDSLFNEKINLDNLNPTGFLNILFIPPYPSI